jgi:hypothetical protein
MSLQLGDMTVLADFTDLKRWAKMLKALSVIAAHLHPAYDVSPDAIKGWSKQSCLFSSLAARDFLVEIGFNDTTVRPCGLVMRATDRDGAELHSLGIGVPGDPDRPDKFNGHAVVTVPQLSLLIDTTLYQAIRLAWGGALTGMMATDYVTSPDCRKIYDRHPFSGAERELPDRRFNIVWFDRPELQWKREQDFRVKNARRRVVTRALVEAFGEWQD